VTEVTLTLPEAFGQAVAAYQQGRLADAEHLCGAILGVAADHFDATRLLRVIQYRGGRLIDALASYDRALALRPDHAETLSNRGNALKDLKRFAEALASYDGALAIRPDYAEAHYNRGITLKELKRLPEALASYDRAVAIRPDYAEAFNNRGDILNELRRFEEAFASYQKAQEIAPDYADAHWNEAVLRLLTGDLAAGWAKYEWRWKKPAVASRRRDFPQPQWDGVQSIADKTILLHAEQGHGDAIQFCRYVPQVAARGARVILRVAASLRKLMTSLAGVAQLVAVGEPLPAFDIHCPLLSLPHAFGTKLETIPAATPYLRAPADAVPACELRLGATRRPRIGVAWAGSRTHQNDRNRSIGLGTLLRFLDADATFVSLQKELRAGDEALLRGRDDIVHLGDGLNDFSDTAALMMNLDLMITVDTSLAHLAGALGMPVWILLPFAPDWRWLLDRDTSPWYPSARLFRQSRPDDWDEVIARVKVELNRRWT
jgi:Tfp pilus assembly protein PilF